MDTLGSPNSTTWGFTVDTVAPPLEITSPTTTITNNPAVTIAGVTQPTATVTVNGTPVIAPGGSFSTTLTLLEGSRSIPVVATDAAGNSRTVNVNIVVDLTPPALSLTSPTDGTTVQVASVTVTGTTETGAVVTVNGIVVDVSASGAFSFVLALNEEANTVTATATDAAGNTRSVSVTVTFANPVPGLEEDLGETEQDLLSTQNALSIIQILLYVMTAIAIAAAGLAIFMFTRMWMGRKGGSA